MNQKPTALIIGAGLTGLAAALRLGEGGRYRPLLLERENEPGGLARSLHFKNFITDMGPHRIHTELPEVQRLIERVAAPSLITVQRRSHIFLRGRYLTYPPAPLEIAAHLGPLRMARFMAGFAAQKLKPAAGPESYESLMRRAFGGPLYEFMLRPYSAKTWKIDPAQIHADTARVRVSAGSLGRMIAGLLHLRRKDDPASLKQFLYVRGGSQTLVRHLWENSRAAGAELEIGSGVTGLEMDESGRIHCAVCRKDDQTERYPGEVVISTAPLPDLLGRLLPGRPELAAAREAAAGLQFIDMIFVCLIVRRPSISGDSWLYFPEPQFIFNRAYEAKSFDPSMGPEGRSVLCLEITHRPGDPLSREADESLLKTVREQIVSTGLFADQEVEEGFVFRLPFAYPLYTLDYADRLRRALDGLRKVPNLITTGRQGLFNHNNMDHAIYMGLKAAELINETPVGQSLGRWYDGVDIFKRLRIVD